MSVTSHHILQSYTFWCKHIHPHSWQARWRCPLYPGSRWLWNPIRTAKTTRKTFKTLNQQQQKTCNISASCPALSWHVLSYPVLFCPTLPCPALPSLICAMLSCPAMFCPLWSMLRFPRPDLCCPHLSSPLLPCAVLCCPALSYPILSCPVLAWPAMTCAVLSCPDHCCSVLSCPFVALSSLPYQQNTCIGSL